MHDTISQLRSEFGDAAVITAAAELDYFARDVFAQGQPLSAVIVPDADSALIAMVSRLSAAGVPMVARGGGLSYTDAFLAERPGSVLIDTRRLNRIVEINETDRYVVAECGVTWAALYQALAEKHLRTPYFGPLSGLEATLGGTLSQGSIFLGSGCHGSVGDSVLSLDVVTASGEMLRTGSAAAAGCSPFFRYFGPDLTGLFIGDAGALGIKLRVSLRLLPAPPHADYLSWQFADADTMFLAMAELARAALPSECFGFDPLLAEVRMKRASMTEDARTMAQVIRRQGLLSGAKLAARGRGFLDVSQYSAHAVIEGCSQAELKEKSRVANRLATRAGGKAISGSIPQALRAVPFPPPTAMLGPEGERWVPVHGVVPHSRASAAFRAIKDTLANEARCLEQHAIKVGFLYTTVGAQGTLIEPVFYWPDSHTSYHQRRVDAEHRRRIGEPSDNPAARTEVGRLKHQLADILRRHGAIHFQLGKFYSYRRGANPAALALFDAIKRQLDPVGLMNPGALRD